MLTKFKKGSKWYSLAFIAMLSAVSILSATAVMAQQREISNGSKSLKEGLSKAWEILFLGISGNGSGSIFQVVNAFMLFFTFMIFLYRALQIYRETTSEKGSEEFIKSLIVDKFVPVAVVLVLLSSNGLMGGYMVLAARNAVYNLDQKTGLQTQVIADTNKLMTDLEGEEEALDRLSAKQANCAGLPPEIDGAANPAVAQCLNELNAQAQAEIGSGAIKSRSTVRKIEQAQASANPLNAFETIKASIGDALSNSLNAIIQGWIITFGILYAIIVEGAMLIMGLIAPIAIASSLLNLKPLIEWITKFAGLGIMKITYTLAVAIYQIVDSVAGKDLGGNLFTAAVGIGAPILSILAAAQSGGIVGAAVEGAVLGAAGQALQFAGGKVGSALGKPAGAAGRIGKSLAAKGFDKVAPAPVKAAAKAISKAARVRK
jgi:hypothetical protein